MGRTYTCAILLLTPWLLTIYKKSIKDSKFLCKPKVLQISYLINQIKCIGILYIPQSNINSLHVQICSNKLTIQLYKSYRSTHNLKAQRLKPRKLAKSSIHIIENYRSTQTTNVSCGHEGTNLRLRRMLVAFLLVEEKRPEGAAGSGRKLGRRSGELEKEGVQESGWQNASCVMGEPRGTNVRLRGSR